MKNLKTIEEFIAKHHLLTLATLYKNIPQCCSLFYCYNPKNNTFIVASDTKTNHIQNTLLDPHVGCSIALETSEIGKIEGVQIEGVLQPLNEKKERLLYFKKFPYALALQPTLWQIVPSRFKYTSNRLGFGKKLIVEF